MGYGQMSGYLGKKLQNPRPGQRSTGFELRLISNNILS